MIANQQTKIDEFIKIGWPAINEKYYYDIGFDRLSFLGVPICKCPLDLWIYQELVYKTRPDLIIETGTLYGGSALYLASLCKLMNFGRVVTIDVNAPPYKFEHERLRFITGSSIDPELVDRLEFDEKLEIEKRKVMVILDSDHSKLHVLKELELYAPLVSHDSYLIVEDTNINGHPVRLDYGPGPLEALEEWLPKHKDFTIDKRCEKFGITFNPNGYLKRL